MAVQIGETGKSQHTRDSSPATRSFVRSPSPQSSCANRDRERKSVELSLSGGDSLAGWGNGNTWLIKLPTDFSVKFTPFQSLNQLKFHYWEMFRIVGGKNETKEQRLWKASFMVKKLTSTGFMNWSESVLQPSLLWKTRNHKIAGNTSTLMESLTPEIELIFNPWELILWSIMRSLKRRNQDRIFGWQSLKT